MKFRCLSDHLKQIIAVAERFTGKHAALVVLSHVLLEVNNTALTVSATNLESAYQARISGDEQKNGRVAVPAKVLGAFLQSLKDERVVLEEKQGNLYIKTDTRHTRINGVGVEDFPLIPVITKTASFRVDAALFRRGLERVLPAVSLSEFKPELRGVWVESSPAGLRLASTDTFRLAEFTAPTEEKVKERVSFILPHRIAQEVARIAPDGEIMEIGIDASYAVVSFGNATIVTRLIDGVFPDYPAIIPKEFETSCFVARPAMADAIRSSSIFASKLQDVRVRVDGRVMEVRSLNQDVGEHTVTVPCAVSGKETDVSFNYRYLLDGIQLLEEEEIFLGLNGEQGKALLRNKNDNSTLYVVMPMRLT